MQSGEARCLLRLRPQVLTCPNASFTDLAGIVSRIEPAEVAAGHGEVDPETYMPSSWGRWWQCPLLTLTLNKLPWAPGWLWQPLDLVGCTAGPLPVYGPCPCSGGDPHGPALCPDESDYQTEFEEVLLGGPKDAYVDFQSAPADQGSDLVSCLDTLCPLAEPRALRAPKQASCSLPAALQGCPHLDLDHVLFTNRRMSPHFGINTEVWLPPKHPRTPQHPSSLRWVEVSTLKHPEASTSRGSISECLAPAALPACQGDPLGPCVECHSGATLPWPLLEGHWP